MASLTNEDRVRIAEAVTEQEARSSGEIVCVVAGEATAYREVSLGWGAAAALVLPPLLLVLGVRPLDLWSGFGGWGISNLPAGEQVFRALTVYVLLQSAVFLIATSIAFIPMVRRFLTPASLKRHHVERLARQQFVAAGVSGTQAQTGVLIFVAMVDRQVMVLADAAINEKAGQAAWDAAAKAVEDGMKRNDAIGGVLAAITLCGDALAAHFPFEGADENLLPNEPVEI